MPALRKLVLRHNDLDDRAAQLLARWPGLARLEICSLTRNRIGDDGAKALAASPFVRSVGELYLDSNLISEEGAAAFENAGLSNVFVNQRVWTGG